MSPLSRGSRLLSPVAATLLLAVLFGCAPSTQNSGAAPNTAAPHLSLVITCTLPGAEPRRIPIPDGRNLTDFCPASAISDRFQHATPGVIYTLPAPADAAPLPPTKDAGQHT